MNSPDRGDYGASGRSFEYLCWGGGKNILYIYIAIYIYIYIDFLVFYSGYNV